MDKYLNKIIEGDCLEVMKRMPNKSVDSIVTDPPYGLEFMGKDWDKGVPGVHFWQEMIRVLKPGGYLLAFGGTRTYHRMACAIEDAGFEIRDMIEWVYASGFPKSLNVFKQLKKNCTCGNMEAYEQGAKQNTESQMRPMSEANLPQEINASKEQGEALQSGLSEQGLSLQQSESTENVWREQSFLEGRNNDEKTERELQGSNLSEMPEGVYTNGEKRRIHNATQISDGTTPEQATNESGSGTSHRPQSEQQQDREPCAFCKQWGTQATRTLGLGTALKPAHEPICMARKPLGEKTVAENVLKYGTGGINIDISRIEHNEPVKTTNRKERSAGWNMENTGFDSTQNTQASANTMGRFPANLIHDNSEEVRECFPETGVSKGGNSGVLNNKIYGKYGTEKNNDGTGFGDSGNASRFFKSIIYTAKASKSERNRGCEGLEEKNGGALVGNNIETQAPGNKIGANPNKQVAMTKNNHPTVKPIALMEYLIKMVTPKGGVVLDPFAGSGSTLVAAKQNGFQFIGIEKEEEYAKIIEARTKDETQLQEVLF